MRFMSHSILKATNPPAIERIEWGHRVLDRGRKNFAHGKATTTAGAEFWFIATYSPDWIVIKPHHPRGKHKCWSQHMSRAARAAFYERLRSEFKALRERERPDWPSL